MTTENILGKAQDKLTVPSPVVADHNQELKSIWASHASRPWDVYSREPFRRFWDEHYTVNVEARSR